MLENDYVRIFVEIYNAGAASILVFLIGEILIMMRRVDKAVLKARIFLSDEILQRTWTYISIAGAAFAIHSLVRFLEQVFLVTISFYGVPLYLYDITQIIFIIAFLLAVYQWYLFIGSISKNLARKPTTEKK